MQKLFYSFLLALICHAFLMLIEGRPLGDDTKEPRISFQLVSINELPLNEENKEDVTKPSQEATPEQTPEPNVKPAAQPVEKEPQLDEEPQLNEEPQLDRSSDTPILMSGSFERWLRQDAKQSASTNVQAVQRFKQSFQAEPRQTKADVLPDRTPMGGGSSKFTRNGVTCEQLVMVPVSMDDHLHGTISTSGKCKREDKMKIEID